MKDQSPGTQSYAALLKSINMRALAEAWPEEAIVQAPLAQLTWFHDLTLLEKLKDRDERLWYVRAAIEHGWSRNVLVSRNMIVMVLTFMATVLNATGR